jgi:hypothetical protein
MAKKIMTPEFRISFPKLFEPGEFDGKLTYSIVMLFPKDADLSALKDAIVTTAEAKWPGKVKGKKMPFKDGNERDYEDYQDMIEVKASTKAEFGKPVVVDRNRDEILDPSEIYSGCWCRAQVTPYAYDMPVNKGIALGLVAVQKVRDDKSIGGGGPSKQEVINAFDELPSEPTKESLFD